MKARWRRESKTSRSTDFIRGMELVFLSGRNRHCRSRLISDGAAKRGVCISTSTQRFEECADENEDQSRLDRGSNAASWTRLLCAKTFQRSAVARLRHEKYS